MSDIIEQKKAALIDELGFFEDPQELFEYIISKTKRAPGLPQESKTETHLIKGCISGLWLTETFKDGRCYFEADADSIITRGIAKMVCEMYSGLTPQEILSFDPEFLTQLRISTQLSPNRRNGLSKLTEKIFEKARAHLA